MSTRTHLAPYTLFNAVSMGVTQTGATILKSLSVVSYDVSWTGTSPTGSLTVQLSNSYKLNPDGSVYAAGSWNSVPVQDTSGNVVTSIPVAGNTGSVFIDVRITGGEAIRLQYTPSGGSGSLTAVVSGKVT